MRIMQRLRAKLRDWLGIEDEMRQFGESFARDVVELRERRDRANTRHDSLRREVEELGMTLGMLRDAVGPLWQTATGHLRPVYWLSDTHLEAILRNGFGGTEVRGAAQDELNRRAEDDRWARRQGTASLRDRVQELELLARHAKGTKKYAAARKALAERLERTGISDSPIVLVTEGHDAAPFVVPGERTALIRTIERNLTMLRRSLED